MIIFRVNKNWSKPLFYVFVIRCLESILQAFRNQRTFMKHKKTGRKGVGRGWQCAPCLLKLFTNKQNTKKQSKIGATHYTLDHFILPCFWQSFFHGLPCVVVFAINCSRSAFTSVGFQYHICIWLTWPWFTSLTSECETEFWKIETNQIKLNQNLRA